MLSAPEFNDSAALRSHYAEIHARLRPAAARKPIQLALAAPARVFVKPAPIDFLGSSGMRFLTALVAAKHGVSYDDMLGRSHATVLAHARSELAFLFRTHTGRSSEELARFLGRDRSGILHGLRQYVGRNPSAAALLASVRAAEGAERRLIDQAVKTRRDAGMTPAAISVELGLSIVDVKVALHRVVHRGSVARRKVRAGSTKVNSSLAEGADSAAHG